MMVRPVSCGAREYRQVVIDEQERDRQRHDKQEREGRTIV
jgi:hypothetical protein